jgi:hypothetical protein
MAKTKERKRRPKQPYLEGMEPPSIPAIDSAADVYQEAKEARMKLSEEESEAKKALIAVMVEHQQTTYKTPDGIMVNLLEDRTVTTKRQQASPNGEA